MTTDTLSDTVAFDRQGWAHRPGYLSEQELAVLRSLVAETQGAPGQHAQSHYFVDRDTAGKMQLARVERLAEMLSDAGLNPLLQRMQADAAQALQSPVAPFKEKLNLRYPGSPGYAPHQDAARWQAFGARFISVGLFLDHSDATRGGFEFADWQPGDGALPRTGDDLDERAYLSLTRLNLTANAGDALLIDGMAPHRTNANDSDAIVPHLLFTFVEQPKGEAREDYYAQQRRQFDHLRLGNVFVFPPRS